jgi:diaminopimelate decarboxylase
MLRHARTLGGIRVIDLGGGLPSMNVARRFDSPLGRIVGVVLGRPPFARYEVPTQATEPEQLVPCLARRLEGLDLWMEPGRWVVADGASIITRIVRKVERRSGSWLYVDADVGLLPDVGFGERRSFAATGHGEARYTVAGSLCLKGDILGRDVVLPPGLAVGDFMVILGTGAYAFSRTSWFGGRLPSVRALENGALVERWRAPELGELLSRLPRRRVHAVA